MNNVDIAVVEPDVLTRATIARILRDAGYCPLLFESEMAFFQSSDAAHAECLILEDSALVVSAAQIQMILSHLKWRPHVIVISAFPTIQKTVEVMRAGVVDVLPKPLGVHELLEAVMYA